MAAEEPSALQSLLHRPLDQRIREFKYRFAQSVVFGLPVLALQRFGSDLGWVEAHRWVGLLQLLLSGWIVYVAAAGMLFEGILFLPARVSADFFIAVAAVTIYFLSTFAVLRSLTSRYAEHAPAFHIAVTLLILWTGLRWFQLSRKTSA